MAVLWAAFFNFAAFFVFHTAVANTVGKTVDSDVVSEAVIFAGLVGAIAWNLTTWWLGLPTSSSHALIGGFAGAGVAKAGVSVLNTASLEKTALFIVLSPLFGMTLGFLLMLANLWLFRRTTPARVDGLFRRLQLVSAAAFSLGHGGNDAQKTMGIISALLVGAGTSSWSRTATCRSRTGSWSPPTRPSPSAPSPGAGGSSRPSASGSPPSSRWAASRPRRPPPAPSTWPPSSASPSPPPTPSPGRSSASAPPAASPPSAGAWLAASSGPGSSPCRPPRSWPPSPTPSPSRGWRWPP